LAALELTLPRLVLYTWSYTSALSALVIFEMGVSLYAQAGLTMIFLTYVPK
jgi:hypothetical protein